MKRLPKGNMIPESAWADYEKHAVPNNPEAERAILGSIILDNALMVQAIEAGIESHKFYIRANQFMWAAMLVLHHEGRSIDPLMLADVLRRDERLNDVGGVSYFTELTYGLPHFTNVRAYAKLVNDDFKLRSALAVQSYNTSILLERDGTTADEKLAQVEANTLEMVGSALRETARRSIEFVDVGEDEAEFRQTLIGYNEGRTDAIETPLPWLNNKLEGGGVQKQGLYMIAAPPKVGKTSMLLWFADHMAHNDCPGGVITMEMRRQALIKRLFAQYAGIPFWMMRRGFHGLEYQQALDCVKPFFAGLRRRLHIVDSISTTAQFRHAARRLVYGPAQAQWLAVDYLQLATATQNPDPRARAQEVAAVSRDLKILAQELNVPVIVISSLNQEGEREGRRPELTDLYWSGQMRYDAEAIMFLHNPDYKRAMSREERIAFDERPTWNVDLLLSAQRNGPTGEVRLTFAREYMKFTVLDDPQPNSGAYNPVDLNVPFAGDEPLFVPSDDNDEWLLA